PTPSDPVAGAQGDPATTAAAEGLPPHPHPQGEGEKWWPRTIDAPPSREGKPATAATGATRMRLSFVPFVIAALLLGPSAYAQVLNPCEAAGQAAEQRLGLPSGLLPAIGRVESGRWDPALGRVAPWPWTIDVAGAGRLFGDRGEAVATTAALHNAGAANIDVGCFQISLLHHPDAFVTLDQAFDPVANAEYAARFLLDLRARLGSWPEAVAAYHSADPVRGVPYRALVYAAWGNPSDPAMAPLPAPDTGMHIWTPSLSGTAPSMVLLSARLPSGSQPRLPRIITPGH
ncbi:MAG: transglycosylase SLT domain-containing protein, partial [Acetobacteraceae bacterium]|nr:transglycosylase SLT domain-containing protein [Acetobacteraceae bacterium]